MGFSLNEAINKRIIESIMAISKFFIDDCPDDYVLRIEIRRASKPVEPEAPDERIYLVIGEVHPALLRPDYKFIRTMEELKKSIEFAWNANELHDLPRMDIFSHDIFYLVQYHLEDDKAVIRVDSGSIIWGRGSSRQVALVEIDDKGNCKFYYYEMEDAFKHYKRATPIEVSGTFDEFIRFLYDYENSTPYPYENMKRAFPEAYRNAMNMSLEDIVNHR